MFGIPVNELVIIMSIMSIPGIFGALIARNKGKNPIIWFFLTSIFVFSIIILISMPSIRENHDWI